MLQMTPSTQQLRRTRHSHSSTCGSRNSNSSTCGSQNSSNNRKSAATTDFAVGVALFFYYFFIFYFLFIFLMYSDILTCPDVATAAFFIVFLCHNHIDAEVQRSHQTKHRPISDIRIIFKNFTDCEICMTLCITLLLSATGIVPFC